MNQNNSRIDKMQYKRNGRINRDNANVKKNSLKALQCKSSNNKNLDRSSFARLTREASICQFPIYLAARTQA